MSPLSNLHPSRVVTLDTGQFYIVRNNTDSRLTTGPNGRLPLLRWDRVAYDCGPHQEVIVPWPVIALYFGDPRSQDGKQVEAEDSRGKHLVPPRGNELNRLSVFYGVYEDGVDRLAEVVPDVTIMTLDRVEVIPPCFDPDGTHVYGFERSTSKPQDVASIITDLQDQIDALKVSQSSMEIHGANDGELIEDIP